MITLWEARRRPQFALEHNIAGMEGIYYAVEGVCLPAGMRYTFPKQQ